MERVNTDGFLGEGTTSTHEELAQAQISAMNDGDTIKVARLGGGGNLESRVRIANEMKCLKPLGGSGWKVMYRKEYDPRLEVGFGMDRRQFTDLEFSPGR